VHCTTSMNAEDYHYHIKLLLKKNPLLKPEDIGIILTLESLYKGRVFM
jgi:hypothetical protein